MPALARGSPVEVLIGLCDVAAPLLPMAHLAGIEITGGARRTRIPDCQLQASKKTAKNQGQIMNAQAYRQIGGNQTNTGSSGRVEPVVISSRRGHRNIEDAEGGVAM